MKRRKPQYLLVAFFPLVMFYFEVVFRLSTVGGLFKWGTVHTVLFCVAYSSIGYLIATIFKNRKWNRICVTAYLFVTAMPYLIWYFIYRKFKMLYDLKTTFGGASDALAGYYKDALKMIFSFSGLFTILLFLLPGILYILFGKKYMNPRKSNWKKRVKILVLTTVIYLVNLAMIWILPGQRTIWHTQYRFENAAGNFGLITGLRLDLKDLRNPRGASFTVEDKGTYVDGKLIGYAVDVEKASEVIAAVEEEDIDYGVNALDIDYASMDASGTIGELNDYVASRTPSSKNKYTGLFKGKNLIFISAEAFSGDIIDPDLTPTLYRLATKGMQIDNFYQFNDAGTTGGEFQSLLGMIPADGGKSMKNIAEHYNYYTVGSMLDREGYYGMAFHNNSYTFYDRNITHENLGYSEGFMGYGNGMEAYVSENWPQSDVEMFEGTVPLYIDQEHFNVYYMTVSGHSNYTYEENGMTQKNWDRVQQLDCSDMVKGYYAAQLELEDALTYLVNELEAKGIADDTVICLAADHFPYGLDDDASLGDMPYTSELYGYEVNNVFQRDHNRLIIWCGSLEEEAPIVVTSPVVGMDILPTLMNLFGVEFDSRLLVGRDIFSDAEPLAFNACWDWKTQYGYFNTKTGKFIQTDEGANLPDDYVQQITNEVGNRIAYCEKVLETDYYRYLFGE